MIRPKPKTNAGKRFLEKREPMLVEQAKTVVFLKGTTCSSIISDAMKDMACLKKPDCVMFTKKNDIHPFDDYKPLEFLSLKNDAAFFVLGNHSKKRPHNIVIARMFDNQILDMIELGVTDISFMDEFKGAKPAVGNRPLILFVGDSWLSSLDLIHAKSMLLDLYSGDRSNEQIDLNGLSHVITFTAENNRTSIRQRTYSVRLKKTGTKEPSVELEPCGPHFDFELRRTLPANPDTLKQALKIPKELKPKKIKNEESNDFGEKTGRVWVDKQDLSKLQTRKMKGLKRAREEDSNEQSQVQDDSVTDSTQSVDD